MSNANENVGLVEILGGLALVVGVCAFAATWWSGQSLGDSLLAGFVFVIAVGLMGLVAEGLKTGKIGVRGGYIYRQKQPIAFWGCAVFYVIAAIAFLGIATTGLLALLLGSGNE